MIRAMLLLGLVWLTGGCAACRRPATASPVTLFNGRDLSGWVVRHGGEWAVEDGVLVGRNGRDWSTDPERSGSWLGTEKTYGDFVLELEYAVQGNSGIFLRSGPDKNPAFTGYEMQLLADAGRAPSSKSSGSLYDVVAAARNMSRPAGEWNQVRIAVEGARIQVEWNGVPTLDFTNATRSARGYVGFQNHDTNSVVRFRNVRLTELR